MSSNNIQNNFRSVLETCPKGPRPIRFPTVVKHLGIIEDP